MDFDSLDLSVERFLFNLFLLGLEIPCVGWFGGGIGFLEGSSAIGILSFESAELE